MITIISPAKSMDFASASPSYDTTRLVQSDKTNSIVRVLQALSEKQIMQIMNVSSKIAKLNHQRFANYQDLPEKAAIFAYDGDVYKNINTATLSPKMLGFAQNNLRILSALYGTLRPLDEIKAYRLEMVAKLPNIAPKGMANFWKNDITQQLNQELASHQNKYLINLASNEYAASIDQSKLAAPIINIHFREIRDNTLKNIALNSKRARGMMTDYIIRNAIDSPEGLKSFQEAGYVFDQNLSDQSNFFWCR